MKRIFLTSLYLTLATMLLTAGLFYATHFVAQAQDGAPQSKIAAWLWEHSTPGQATEALVILRERADLTGAARLETKEAKGRFVRAALLAQAQQSQRALLDWLTERGIEHRAYYIVNAIWVKTTPEIIAAIAARHEVERIDANPRIKNQFEPKLSEEELEQAVAAVKQARSASPDAIELGVNTIRAPEVWALGFTGQGIVIAGADTGVNWQHSALKNNYRGWNGSSADHNYNWHDSIHTNGGVNPCGVNSTQPCDDDDHGTHTIGTAVGTDGGANQIGVAPGARWIACRNMDSGNGAPATYIECMEWFLAPYPIGGTPQQGDPSKAPDITTNSWGCPPSEGCQPASLQAAVEAQRAAGIMMVVAAGNSGSSCSTVSDPPSFYAASYTVGAFSASTSAIASFSSRGPITADGSNRLKPEITAPGVTVRSALKSGGYGSLSGTSMATPHVAGALALLWSARPAYRHQIAQTIDLVNQAAVDVPLTACSSSGVPNNVWGWGRLDIKAAVDAATGGCTYQIAPASAAAAASGGPGATAITITADAGCAWTAASNNTWLTITSASSGTGNGAVTYAVAANTGAARAGTLTVAGQTFMVNQAAAGVSTVAKKADFDGDGLADLSVWRGPTSQWLVQKSSNAQLQTTLWGTSLEPFNDLPVPGDYDGDGKIDVAIYRRLSGTWYIILSANNAFRVQTWGIATDTPVPGDYDGDGKTDIAVWRGNEGNWYILRSSNNTTQVVNWGVAYAPFNDVPVPADYDGDGKCDIAVWRPLDGTWYAIRSSNGSFLIQPHGQAGDTPVPGDYDGDGKCDLAYWRGAQSAWSILRSSNSTIQTVTWGTSLAPYNDIPTPADYDGDGKFDIAVWRPFDGTWYVIRSSNGSFLIQTLGQAGDLPCPATGIR
ncbi:MAG: S8 family serine peptidase [Acidobacteria bacterium]|nr:S8 family serine peptidase [Acidobacteriota bacterium]MBI3423036.1 S8 family serine peptidase [Acidobacteriota bacterium]